MSSVEDYYRARFLYRMSLGGEAVEAALATFSRTLSRQGELQTAALEDILIQLKALLALAQASIPDAATAHRVLRDLVRVFEGPADNAQAFMAGVARTIDLQQADIQAVIAFKPARHLSLQSATPAGEEHLPATTLWADAPPVPVHPWLREQGERSAPGRNAGMEETR